MVRRNCDLKADGQKSVGISDAKPKPVRQNCYALSGLELETDELNAIPINAALSQHCLLEMDSDERHTM
jgi:hypothetical protein